MCTLSHLLSVGHLSASVLFNFSLTGFIHYFTTVQSPLTVFPPQLGFIDSQAFLVRKSTPQVFSLDPKVESRCIINSTLKTSNRWLHLFVLVSCGAHGCFLSVYLFLWLWGLKQIDCSLILLSSGRKDTWRSVQTRLFVCASVSIVAAVQHLTSPASLWVNIKSLWLTLDESNYETRCLQQTKASETFKQNTKRS